jgi:myo-inositol-1(or 4)-monophosphatase
MILLQELKMNDPIEVRLTTAKKIAAQAASIALEYFNNRDALLIESKGPQDMVSQADKNVEIFIREEITKFFPDDAIIGEEMGRTEAEAAFTWVIDPIDGTANFVNGIPAWCVVISCVLDAVVVIGVIVDPNHNNHYWACKGHGAYLDGKPMSVSTSKSIRDGSVGVGYCSRITPETLMPFLESLLKKGGIYYRNASGALMLAYVASGKLTAYHEAHINSWDCLAGLLMIEEAGGVSWPYNTEAMMQTGAAILAGAPEVFAELEPLANYTKNYQPNRH